MLMTIKGYFSVCTVIIMIAVVLIKIKQRVDFLFQGSERRDRTRTTSYDFNSRDFYIGNTNKGRNYSYSNSFSGHSE